MKQKERILSYVEGIHWKRSNFILYKIFPNHDELAELDYLKQLAVALIGTISVDEKLRPRPQLKTKVSIPPRLATIGQYLQKPQGMAVSGSRGRRSKYMCEACKIHLCIDKCFKRYHTQR